jgi:hypothetical protein
VKDAQLAGGGQEAVDMAIRNAKQQALKAQLLTIGATDPKGALNRFKSKKDIAGDEYATLHEHLKNKAINQVGSAAGEAYFKKTQGGTGWADPRLPIFTQVSKSNPGAMSPQGLARTVKIESSGNPNAGAGRSHQGLVQASDKWWNQFGQGSRLDPEAAIQALGRSTAHDRPILAKDLGRPPSDGELYLAHQQGVGGASALLKHPNMMAADALMMTGAYKNPVRLQRRLFAGIWAMRTPPRLNLRRCGLTSSVRMSLLKHIHRPGRLCGCLTSFQELGLLHLNPLSRSRPSKIRHWNRRTLSLP